MDGEVVDGFVGGDGDVRRVAGLGEHGEDGAGVGGCKGFSLEVGESRLEKGMNE